MRRIFVLIILFLFSFPFISAQDAPLNLDGLDEVIPTNITNNANGAKNNVPLQNSVSGSSSESGVQNNATEINNNSATKTTPDKKQSSFWDLIIASGLIGYMIILLSLVAVALIIEYALTIRRKTLIPTTFADEVLKLLSQGQLAAALQRSQSDTSPLAQILCAAMKQFEFGWEAVEKAAEETTAELAARLYRKIEYLNVIANIAPMLGLLGTVVGMVVAFQQLAESEGYARASDLANGIYLALVTTVEGLLVAIPSLAAYSFFSNRIAALVAETVSISEQVLLPIKKNFAAKKREK